MTYLKGSVLALNFHLTGEKNLTNFWNVESSLWKADSGFVWVVFQVWMWFGFCWKSSTFETFINQQNTWKYGSSDGTCPCKKITVHEAAKILGVWFGSVQAVFKDSLNMNWLPPNSYLMCWVRSRSRIVWTHTGTWERDAEFLSKVITGEKTMIYNQETSDTTMIQAKSWDSLAKVWKMYVTKCFKQWPHCIKSTWDDLEVKNID